MQEPEPCALKVTGTVEPLAIVMRISSNCFPASRKNNFTSIFIDLSGFISPETVDMLHDEFLFAYYNNKYMKEYK